MLSVFCVIIPSTALLLATIDGGERFTLTGDPASRDAHYQAG